MKDHTIYPVIAYWVDKDTLNYVTVESAVKRVPMDQVDRDMSRQLNDQRERRIQASGACTSSVRQLRGIAKQK